MKDVNPDRLNNTLSKQYQFDTKGLLRRAAGLTKANFSSLFQGSLVLFLAFVVLGGVAQQYITINDDGSYVFEHQSIIQIVAICIVAPLLTGLYMMGVFVARGVKISVFTVFQFFPLIFLVALTQLVNSILVQLGMMLLILPGVYFYLASSFSLMLVADRKLTPISAIILSCRVFNAYWAHIASIFGVLFLLFVSVPLTFGVSLIWVLPFYFSMMGLLYQELIGEQGVSTEASVNDVNESSFDA
ncbi:stress protein [Alteromonas sp. BL110]|uniref:stress protein n=1 Tax=Alteromonas sp. BL110 TaxID=1714845 RepID=UPI000E5250D8|nr:stress protein [Alteromonas sp. BL110]AXT40276.1 stress protein [Alteromonas sp. BL110]RKM79508.1 stress protein [Alteromonas sp. BL110]